MVTSTYLWSDGRGRQGASLFMNEIVFGIILFKLMFGIRLENEIENVPNTYTYIDWKSIKQAVAGAIDGRTDSYKLVAEICMHGMSMSI